MEFWKCDRSENLSLWYTFLLEWYHVFPHAESSPRTSLDHVSERSHNAALFISLYSASRTLFSVLCFTFYYICFYSIACF